MSQKPDQPTHQEPINTPIDPIPGTTTLFRADQLMLDERWLDREIEDQDPERWDGMG